LKRYGIFGGTFNPPHIGHSILAENMREQLSLDKVIFIPSGVPPLKESKDLLSAEHRLKMTKIAFERDPNFEVCNIEIADSLSGKKSYTVDTIKKLYDLYKNDFVKLYLIIGIDNLIDFPKWKDPGKLFTLSEVIVMNRPGFTVQDVDAEFSEKAKYANVPMLEISSTKIRECASAGRSIKYLVFPEIEQYIAENKLYSKS
jgi:nicotinate-nucleotide adenylyltransferase